MRLDRRFVLAGILALTPLLAQAGADAEQKTLRVGIMSAEDEDVWAVVAEQAKTKGLDVRLVVFNDYTQPNGVGERRARRQCVSAQALP